jgi:hypothetical protein
MSGNDREPRDSGRRRASKLVSSSTSIALLALLSGCTIGGLHGYPIFDTEALPADERPAELEDQDLHGIDIDSLRFATEYEGDRLYLAKGSAPEGGICILVDGPEHDGVSTACGAGDWVGVEGEHKYHVHPDGTPLPDDVYTDLTENISVETARRPNG